MLFGNIDLYMTGSNAYVLSGKCKTVVEPRTMQNRFKSYLNEAQIDDANFHSLRHTFATRCIERGMAIEVVQELMGHADPATTLKYYVAKAGLRVKAEWEKHVLCVA